MKPIKTTVEKVLTEMLEHSTKGSRISTPTPTQSPKFRTLDDPVLEEMARAARRYVQGWNDPEVSPHWLTFCGGVGTGKTHLALTIYDASVKTRLRNHDSLLSGVSFHKWSEIIDDLRSGKFHRISDLIDANLLVLDDVGAERDTTGFATDRLWRVLDGRIGKWTVITTNLTLERISSELDVRIASRIIRGYNSVVKCDTTDYALRPKEACQ